MIFRRLTKRQYYQTEIIIIIVSSSINVSNISRLSNIPCMNQHNTRTPKTGPTSSQFHFPQAFVKKTKCAPLPFVTVVPMSVTVLL